MTPTTSKNIALRGAGLVLTGAAVLLLSFEGVVHGVRVVDPQGRDGAIYWERTKPGPETFEVQPAVRLHIEGLSPIGTLSEFIAGEAIAASGTMIALSGREGAARHVLTAKHVVGGALQGLLDLPGHDISQWRVTQFDRDGNPSVFRALAAWVHPGRTRRDDPFCQNDLAVISIAGESESFAVPAREEAAPGTPFFFAGAGLAGGDEDGVDGADFGLNGEGDDAGDDRHDRALDTRMGILRRGENRVSHYREEANGQALGRVLAYDLDLPGEDPLRDNAFAPPLALEARTCNFDSGTGFLIEKDGQMEVIGVLFAGVSTFNDYPGEDLSLRVEVAASTAAYRAWLERIIELDHALAELRRTALRAISGLPETRGRRQRFGRQVEEGFAHLYAAEGAVAHVELALPERPDLSDEETGCFDHPSGEVDGPAAGLDPLGAKYLLQAQAMGHWRAAAGWDQGSDIVERLAGFGLETIARFSLDEARQLGGTEESARHLANAEMKIGRAAAAVAEGRAPEAFAHLRGALISLVNAVEGRKAGRMLFQVEAGGDQAADSDSIRLEVRSAAGCALESLSAWVDIGCAQVPVGSGQTIDLIADGLECAFTEAAGLFEIRANTAILIATVHDVCGNSDTYAVDVFADGGSAAAGADFVRGDANTDSAVDLSDAIFSLNHLYLGGSAPLCPDAADANDDGELDISDPVLTLAAIFLSGYALPAPYPTPGQDSTSDRFQCGRRRVTLRIDIE